jgi:hypothetical protein
MQMGTREIKCDFSPAIFANETLYRIPASCYGQNEVSSWRPVLARVPKPTPRAEEFLYTAFVYSTAFFEQIWAKLSNVAATADMSICL